MNKLIKKVIGSILSERRMAGENRRNWTKICGSVASTINLQCGRGRNDVLAYTAVYSQCMDHDYTCTKEVARKCWTVADHLGVSIIISLLHFYDSCN